MPIATKAISMIARNIISLPKLLSRMGGYWLYYMEQARLAGRVMLVAQKSQGAIFRCTNSSYAPKFCIHPNTVHLKMAPYG